MYQLRSSKNHLVEAFNIFKKNMDYFDPSSDDYLYTLFFCEQLYRHLDSQAKSQDVHPQSLYPDPLTLFKIARKIAQIRAS